MRPLYGHRKTNCGKVYDRVMHTGCSFSFCLCCDPKGACVTSMGPERKICLWTGLVSPTFRQKPLRNGATLCERAITAATRNELNSYPGIETEAESLGGKSTNRPEMHLRMPQNS